MAGRLWGNHLDVHLDGHARPVGALRRAGEMPGEPIPAAEANAGGIFFRYAPEYLTARDATPLSVRMPLREDEFDDGATRAFFANLLPEGQNLTRLARLHDVDETSIFDVLGAMGTDCAGAISVLPAGAPPLKQPGRFPDDYTLIGNDELRSVIEGLKAGRSVVPDDAQDAPLAGVQYKTAVFVAADRRLYWAHRNAPTTHILKVASADFPGGEENEVFCMQLAARLGLNTAEAELRLHADQPIVLVRRFDRVVSADGEGFSVTRLHQEDFCQALGYRPAQKYTHRGGPSAAQLFPVAASAGAPALLRLHLLRAMIYCYLIANADAHAKNFALLYQRGRGDAASIALAPLYDLAAIALYPKFRQGMALAIGGAQDYAAIDRAAWAAFAKEAGLRSRFVVEQIRDLATQILPVARALKDSNRMFRDFIAGRIIDAIGAQIETLNRNLDFDIPVDTAPFFAKPPGWGDGSP
jgi:serine/threonine-protein kinase HipA